MQLPPRRAADTPAVGTGARRGLLWLLAVPMLVFLILPLTAMILRLRVPALLDTLGNAQVNQAITLSLGTSSISTAITILLGTPLAYLLARRAFRGRALLDTVIDLPMILPPAVAGIALLMAFGRRGLVGAYLNDLGLTLAFTQTAVILAQIFVAAPFYIKAASAGFAEVAQDLEQAAALDGASGWQVFRYITAPLAWPALFGGAVMTWSRALGEFGATIIFAGNFPGRTQTMPLAIYIGFELDMDVALTLAAILLATSFGVLMLVKGLLRRQFVTA